MNLKPRPFVVSLLMLLSFGCDDRAHNKQANAQSEGTVQEDGIPLLKIEVTPIIKLDQPLQFHWKLTNRSAKILYVYSTLLKDPNTYFAEINIDADVRMIDVRFTSLEPLEVAPNYFPKTEFMHVEPEQSLEGAFVSHDPLERLVSYRAVNKSTKGQTITLGAWKIRTLLAYGYEVQSVEEALAKSVTRGTEHPINPIVRWQKVAYSEPISITVMK